jgi:hypothetical protein
MSDLLKYSDVIVSIQDEMGSQAPAESKIARNIDSEVLNIKTKYNTESYLRTTTIDVKTDGKTEYELSDIITDNDVEEIKAIYDADGNIFTSTDIDQIIQDSAAGRPINQYCFFFDEGVRKLVIMSTDLSDTEIELNIKYYTNNVALDTSGDFLANISSTNDTDVILLPAKYRDLVSLGTQKRLFYQAIGETDTAQVGLVRNRYTAELAKLGLSDSAKEISRRNNRIKLRVQW